MAKKWYNVLNEVGADKATILIYDIIGGSFFEEGVTAKDFANTLLNLEKDYPSIDIRINSPGGSVFEGLAIVNAIQNSKSTIHTYIDGIAYSMAAIIALSSQKVHIAKNGRLMLHNASMRVSGNAQELRTAADNLDGYDESLLMTISAITGLTDDEVKTKYFNFKDNYFNATQARDNKLVHEILNINAEGVDNLIKIDEYKAVLDYYKELDPAAFKMPEAKVIPTPPTKQDNMKYVALAALVAIFKDGKTPTAVEITAAQAELTAENTGLVIVKAEDNKALNDTKKNFDELTTALMAELFPNATAEGKYNVVDEVKALKTKAVAYDALDGDEKTRHNKPPELTEAQKTKALLDAMPHNKLADASLS